MQILPDPTAVPKRLTSVPARLTTSAPVVRERTPLRRRLARAVRSGRRH